MRRERVAGSELRSTVIAVPSGVRVRGCSKMRWRNPCAMCWPAKLLIATLITLVSVGGPNPIKPNEALNPSAEQVKEVADNERLEERLVPEMQIQIAQPTKLASDEQTTKATETEVQPRKNSLRTRSVPLPQQFASIDDDDDDHEDEDEAARSLRLERRNIGDEAAGQLQARPPTGSTTSYSDCEPIGALHSQQQLPRPTNELLARKLAQLYRLDSTDASGQFPADSTRTRPPTTSASSSQQMQTDANKIFADQSDTTNPKAIKQSPARTLLPQPTNVTVLIISWYPPALKLSWQLNELDSVSDGSATNPTAEIASRLDFYEQPNDTDGSDDSIGSDSSSAFDLDLALNETGASNVDSNAGGLLDEFRKRRALLARALSCFQVTYNIINSQFKVTEEYPPHLRSILLERLVPATEYSLKVSAIYLNGQVRRDSQRVRFVSPTDNESRRFKENTYRPIHNYPDERRPARIGLAQVRSEELTIVAIAIIFWIATICLFFNKWGKIRMLEPYQPAYREAAAVATPLAAATAAAAPQVTTGSAARASNLVTRPSAGSLMTHSSSTQTGNYNNISALLVHEQRQQSQEATESSAKTFAGLATTTSGKQLVGRAPSIGSEADQGGAATAAASALASGGRRRDTVPSNERASLSSTPGLPIGLIPKSGSRPQQPQAQQFQRRRTGTTEFSANVCAPLLQAQAALAWPASQKWRQQQFRSRHLAASAAAATDELETLRLMGDRLAALRRAQMASIAAAALVSRNKQQQQQQQQQIEPPTSHIHQRINRPPDQIGPSQTKGSIPSSTMGQHSLDGNQVQERALRQRHAIGSSSVPQEVGRGPAQAASGGSGAVVRATSGSDSAGSASGAEQAQRHKRGSGAQQTQPPPHVDATNRLRRLQFVSKLHQHHHLATSVSSSTLTMAGGSQTSGGGGNPTTTTTTTQRGQSDSAGNLSRHGPNEPPPTQSSTCASPAPPPSRLDVANAKPADSQHTHILIEPPSPPNRSASGSNITVGAGARSKSAAKTTLTATTKDSFERGPAERNEPDNDDDNDRNNVLRSDGFRCKQEDDTCGTASGSQRATSAANSFTASEFGAAGSRELAGTTRGRLDAAAGSSLVVVEERAARRRSVPEPNPASTPPPEICLQAPPPTPPAMGPVGVPSGSASSSALSRLAAQSSRSGSRLSIAGPLSGLGSGGGGGDDAFAKLAEYQRLSRLGRQTRLASAHTISAAAGAYRCARCGSLDAARNALAALAAAAAAAAASNAHLRHQSFACPLGSDCPTCSGSGGGLSAATAAAIARRARRPTLALGSTGAFTLQCALCGGPMQPLLNAADEPALNAPSPSGCSAGSSRAASATPTAGPHRSAAALAATAPLASARGPSLLTLDQAKASSRSAAGSPQPAGRHFRSPSGLSSCELSGSDASADGSTGVLFGAGSSMCGSPQSPRPVAYSADAGPASASATTDPSQWPRQRSVFVASPYSRSHRDSFAMLRALSQKKSKSAEDVAYLSRLVLQIWACDEPRNPLLQSVSAQQLSQESPAHAQPVDAGAGSQRHLSMQAAARRSSGSQSQQQQPRGRHKPKSSLAVIHL